jgi:hypothetical protein
MRGSRSVARWPDVKKARAWKRASVRSDEAGRPARSCAAVRTSCGSEAVSWATRTESDLGARDRGDPGEGGFPHVGRGVVGQGPEERAHPGLAGGQPTGDPGRVGPHEGVRMPRGGHQEGERSHRVLAGQGLEGPNGAVPFRPGGCRVVQPGQAPEAVHLGGAAAGHTQGIQRRQRHVVRGIRQGGHQGRASPRPGLPLPPSCGAPAHRAAHLRIPSTRTVASLSARALSTSLRSRAASAARRRSSGSASPSASPPASRGAHRPTRETRARRRHGQRPPRAARVREGQGSGPFGQRFLQPSPDVPLPPRAPGPRDPDAHGLGGAEEEEGTPGHPQHPFVVQDPAGDVGGEGRHLQEPGRPSVQVRPRILRDSRRSRPRARTRAPWTRGSVPLTSPSWVSSVGFPVQGFLQEPAGPGRILPGVRRLDQRIRRLHPDQGVAVAER